MNDDRPEEPKPIVEISRVSYEIIKATVNGKPAQFAIVDDEGKILAAGPEVAKEIQAVAINAIRREWISKGILRVNSVPKALTKA